MRALSLTEPWASLLAIRAKTIETRSWKTNYRGVLAIHSAKSFPKYAREMMAEPIVYEAWRQFDPTKRVPGIGFHHGCVIGTCKLVDCITTEHFLNISEDTRIGQRRTLRELFLGDYSDGRYAWIIEGASLLAVPIPYKGSLGLWNLPVEYCDSCDGVGLMEGWNRRDGYPCPKCKGNAIVLEEEAVCH